METIKRIYALLLRGNGLKTREIAKELKLDVYHVADVMFSPDCIQYWYQNDSSLWFAKEGAIQIEEPEWDDLVQNVIIPKNINKSTFLEGEPGNCLSIYLNEISRYRVYPEKEVSQLFTRYRKGDILAYNLLVKSHLRLVANIAKFYKGKGLPLEDVIQEGSIGLLYAIERFDHTRNSSFIEFASGSIIQRISSSLNNLSNMVRIPQNQVILHRKLQRFIDLFEQQFERIPTIYEVDLDTEADLIIIYNLPRDLLDTIEFVDNWDDIRDIDDNTPDKFLLQESDKYHIESLLHYLNERERGILKSYFGVDCEIEGTLNTISARYDITPERTRQLIVKAIEQLQKVERMRTLIY